jgi:hypothetical protein
MKNLDAYHDGLLAAHNEAYEYDPPWTAVCADDGEDGFLVIDETGESDGDWYETEAQAQAAADKLNKEAMEGNDDFYID